MRFLDLTLPSLPENLALDEALLLACESGTGSAVLRIWEWTTPAVVLGAGGVLAEDIDETACVADGVAIARRSSGGGTVLLGQGCLCYSVVAAYDRAPELRHIGPSYCHILGCLCKALAVPGLSCAGVSDLALGALKVSGNSQQRKREHLLHHGTLLYAFNMERVGTYLRVPARQPEYRRQRPHREFLTNLPLERQEIVERLRLAFGADRGMDEWPVERVRQLAESKYATPEWTRRR